MDSDAIYFRYTFLNMSAAAAMAAKAAMSERPIVTGCNPTSLFMESALVVIVPMSVLIMAMSPSRSTTSPFI